MRPERGETPLISNETVSSYLERLASGAPTPGGGAAAGLHAAQAAALVSMVAEFTSGPRYADVQEQAQQISEHARLLMRQGLFAAEEDERLFGALGAAYKLPKESSEQKSERSAAIQNATIAAATPLVSTVEASIGVLKLGQRLLPIGNRSVLSDVAAAAEAARAALATALATLEMNISSIKDIAQRDRLVQAASQANEAIAHAEELSAQARTVVAA
ncbi:cyclodeaminase/cyclohydrolase family protein [Glutamicibacter sp. NPDC087673]|uniref:cyclodeaminase/cyclohydrolase family protein n=1 Tax=Glutamicibacter sp. NPDC087673 TaxID=3363997 RepID=UPI00380E7EE0